MTTLSQWLEIPAELGAPLWAVYRLHMGRGSSTIHVHETFSDPDGERGTPTMMTVIGLRGGASVMRLETTWILEDRADSVTRYWLPAERPEES